MYKPGAHTKKVLYLCAWASSLHAIHTALDPLSGLDLGSLCCKDVALLGSLSQDLGDQLDTADRVVVGRNRVRNDAGVDIGICDGDGGDVEPGGLLDGDHVLKGVEDNNQVGAEGLSKVSGTGVGETGGVGANNLLGVSDGAGAPLGGNIVGAAGLCSVDGDMIDALTGTDEEDDSSLTGDGLGDGAGATEVGQGMLEVDNTDPLTDTKDKGHRGHVPERGAVSQMQSCGQKLSDRQGVRGRVALQCRLWLWCQLTAHRHVFWHC